MLHSYELVVVYDPDLDQAGINTQIEKLQTIVTAHSGSVERKDVWGRKQLAYPIGKKSYGVYVVLVITGDNQLVADLKRQLRINDQVLRSLVVKKDKFAPDLNKEMRDEVGNMDRPYSRPSNDFGGDDLSDRDSL